jgi:hypothetical protein
MKRGLAVADEYEDSDRIRWKDGSDEGGIKRDLRRGTKVYGVGVWIWLQKSRLADVGTEFLGSSRGGSVSTFLGLSHQKHVI